MTNSKGGIGLGRRLANRLYPVTLLIGFVISIGFPAAYYMLESKAMKQTGTIYAQEFSKKFQDLILSSPTLWKYQIYKYSQIFDDELVPHSDVMTIHVLDEAGQPITGHKYATEQSQSWWNASAPIISTPIIFNKRLMGTLQISMSQDKLLSNTLLLLLFSTTTGVSLATLVYYFPVTIARKMEGQIQHLIETTQHDASHDQLTDLPNRALLQERLKQAIQQAKREKNYIFALLFLDLDRFKIVNDSLGHTVGDQLLIAIARRLQMCLRSEDTIARFGGDEFAILLNDIQDINYATHIAERIKQELALPFNLEKHQVFTSASIGIVLSSEANSWLDDPLGNADIAMYQAKSAGKARYEVFDTAMRNKAVTRLQLATELWQALERQEFRLHYQPIVALETGSIAGFEALVRWEHAERGQISPTEFIPIAEENGVIVPLGQWVLREACCQMHTWQVQFPTSPALTISVNLSVKQFTQPDLIEQIAQILCETHLDARSLRLEITESVLVENNESVIAVLLQLKALGVLLSMDDFGTGYSSLSYLHRFPIDTLKIDRSFVSKMGFGDKNAQIVQVITLLARALDMDVIAEGIETVEQQAQLSALQCKYGQGYLFSKPLNSEAAGALIAQNIGGMTSSYIAAEYMDEAIDSC